jgi:hypothetical protein
MAPTHTRHEHDHHRRVVDEGAQDHGAREQHEQRDVGVERPDAGEQPSQRLEGAGDHQRPADDHQAADRDQRLVPESGEDLPDAELAAVVLVRKEVEAERQPGDHDQAGDRDRDALAREEEERDDREREDGVGVCVGEEVGHPRRVPKKKPRLRGVVVHSGASLFLFWSSFWLMPRLGFYSLPSLFLLWIPRHPLRIARFPLSPVAAEATIRPGSDDYRAMNVPTPVAPMKNNGLRTAEWGGGPRAGNSRKDCRHSPESHAPDERTFFRQNRHP